MTDINLERSAQRARRLRLLAAAGALALLLAALAAWLAGSAGRSRDEEPSGAAVPAVRAADRLVLMFPASVTPPDLPLVQAEMNRYLLGKLDASVEIKPVDMSSWWDRTGLVYASGSQVDLMFTAGWMRFGDEVSRGRFLPLDELLQRAGAGISRVLDPEILRASRIGGKLYGIPTNKEFAASKGIVLRADLVEKYGIRLDTVRTLADLGPVLETIKRGEPALTPLQVRADRSPLTFLLQYGLFDMLGDGPGVLERAGGSLRVVNLAATETYRDYARLMQEWKLKGYLNADAVTSRDSEYEAVKAGAAFAFAESMKPGFEIQASRNTGMPMVAVELTKPYTTTADVTSAMFAIPRTSRHPEKAMRLLELLYTDRDLLNLLDWGIEGKHYVVRPDGRIAYPPGVDARSVRYNFNLPWMFGNQLNSYLWDNEDPQQWDNYRRFNEQAEPSKALGFVFDPAPVSNEIAACSRVDEEFSPALITGELDPDAVIPMYLERLKAAGADKVIAEKQRQLDAWLAAGGASAGEGES
ncbi:ABC transporter substrate-binding protein [Paenibacillus albicereus]|uniref:ABC transporter substrate-binding protein n=1 Tax=Paenibacillus albicereus TaxID=2726185 RepID=A0A6H2GYY7_9BACL|nr:ABC transporter substrate-binding protein [Paenibacillus albicereus]QJC52607.1 ABC transporter substrate-binding protein [Paenibacillus albicereus]